MADVVTTQILLDGRKSTVIKFTNVSDGTGETAVLKVDASTLNGAPSEVRVEKVWYATQGIGLQMLWDATTDVLFWLCPINQCATVDFHQIGGLVNNAGAGKTGDILFTTLDDNGAVDPGDGYTVILWLHKIYG